jgi:hypothetical protein
MSESQQVPLPPAEVPIYAAYGQQVMDALTGGAALGPNDVVFICPPNGQPIPGGPWTLPEITNNFVYQVADSLLVANTPLYDPASQGSYIQKLQRYDRRCFSAMA